MYDYTNKMSRNTKDDTEDFIEDEAEDKIEDVDDNSEIDSDDDQGGDDEGDNAANDVENLPNDVDVGQHDDQCVYNYVDAKSDDEDDDQDIVFDDDINIVEKKPSGRRITKPFMTKYERVRLLGVRTQQLISGAKPMIKNTQNLTPKQIAELEIENNVLPLIIKRPLPNGQVEYWKTSELKRIN